MLTQYIPEKAVPYVFTLIRELQGHVRVVNQRVTRHGDYKRLPDGRHLITVNSNLNKYRFLITLIHELAHLVAFTKYGRYIKPHGKEWKSTFQRLMLPLLHPEIFPDSLLPLLARHFKNPKASSDTDAQLSLALKRFDPESDKNYIFEVPKGSLFKLYNGKVFRKGDKRVKRYECMELKSGKIYLFQPNAEVEIIHEIPDKELYT